MTVKALIKTSAASPTGRSNERRAVRLEAVSFLADGSEANCEIHNISTTGLLMETDVNLDTGEYLQVKLPETGEVDARIVWRSNNFYGCEFENCITAASISAAQLQSAPLQSEHRAGLHMPPRGLGGPLGVQLSMLRKQAGLTLSDVAEALGVSKPTVWAWEKGKARPLPDRFDAIARLFGVDVAELARSRSPSEPCSVVAQCRLEIANACGTSPSSVRILIEL